MTRFAGQSNSALLDHDRLLNDTQIREVAAKYVFNHIAVCDCRHQMNRQLKGIMRRDQQVCMLRQVGNFEKKSDRHFIMSCESCLLDEKIFALSNLILLSYVLINRSHIGENRLNRLKRPNLFL